MLAHTEHGDYNVYLEVGHYTNNNNTALQLFTEHGSPFATITTNIVDLPEGCAAIDINNCPWALEFLERYELVKDYWFPVQSGFCVYPVVQLDLEKLKEIAKEMVA